VKVQLGKARVGAAGGGEGREKRLASRIEDDSPTVRAAGPWNCNGLRRAARRPALIAAQLALAASHVPLSLALHGWTQGTAAPGWTSPERAPGGRPFRFSLAARSASSAGIIVLHLSRRRPYSPAPRLQDRVGAAATGTRGMDAEGTAAALARLGTRLFRGAGHGSRTGTPLENGTTAWDTGRLAAPSPAACTQYKSMCVGSTCTVCLSAPCADFLLACATAQQLRSCQVSSCGHNMLLTAATAAQTSLAYGMHTPWALFARLQHAWPTTEVPATDVCLHPSPSVHSACSGMATLC
jgi:hypothetical protein